MNELLTTEQDEMKHHLEEQIERIWSRRESLRSSGLKSTDDRHSSYGVDRGLPKESKSHGQA